MLKELVSAAVDILLGRVALAIGAILVVAPVVVALSYGTDALIALGLSRNVAGSIVTLAVVAACAYGLYLFGTRMIDW